MSAGNFSVNASNNWFIANDDFGVHIASEGTFDSGVIAVEKEINGHVYAVRDEFGAAITKNAAFDLFINFKRGDKFRLTLSGATSPDIDWQVTGNVSGG